MIQDDYRNNKISFSFPTFSSVWFFIILCFVYVTHKFKAQDELQFLIARLSYYMKIYAFICLYLQYLSQT